MKGIFTKKDGSKYVGEFKDGQKDGFGSMKYSNGDAYEGNWK